jgi:hypothetical protein
MGSPRWGGSREAASGGATPAGAQEVSPPPERPKAAEATAREARPLHGVWAGGLPRLSPAVTFVHPA